MELKKKITLGIKRQKVMKNANGFEEDNNV